MPQTEEPHTFFNLGLYSFQILQRTLLLERMCTNGGLVGRAKETGVGTFFTKIDDEFFCQCPSLLTGLPE